MLVCNANVNTSGFPGEVLKLLLSACVLTLLSLPYRQVMASGYDSGELLYLDEYDVNDMFCDSQKESQLSDLPGRFLDLCDRCKSSITLVRTNPLSSQMHRYLTSTCLWPAAGGCSPSHAPAAWHCSAPFPAQPLQQDMADACHVETSEFDQNSTFDIALPNISGEGNSVQQAFGGSHVVTCSD